MVAGVGLEPISHCFFAPQPQYIVCDIVAKALYKQFVCLIILQNCG